MMMNYAKDLHRKGELSKVDEMEKLAKRMERNSKGGLAPAFLTEAYLGFDCFAMLPTKPEWAKSSGYVLFDEDTQKATFIKDDEE
jgi:hypothetical protein